jgi:aspartate ammonia-lyase
MSSADGRIRQNSPLSRLPARKWPEAGSSIMPGKVNPVIPEAVGQAALSISMHDQALMQACSMGNLELNQYFPLIADSLLPSLDLARNACRIFERHCVAGIAADEDRCRQSVETATATATALVDLIGYAEAEAVAQAAEESGQSIRRIVVQRGLLTAEQFDQAVAPEAVTRLGSK